MSSFLPFFGGLTLGGEVNEGRILSYFTYLDLCLQRKLAKIIEMDLGMI